MKKLSAGYYLRNAHRIGIRLAAALAYSRKKVEPSGGGLLIVKPDAIGDQVLFSFVLPCIRKSFPNHPISILVQEHVAEFYRKCPFVDEVLPFDKNRYYAGTCEPLRLMRRVRRRRFDIVLHAVLSRDTAGDQISIASGARRVIGMKGDQVTQPGYLKRLHEVGYTEIVPEAGVSCAFEGHRYLSIPAHLGIPNVKEDWRPLVWLDEKDRSEAVRTIRELGVRPKQFAAVAPGSGVREKCWPADRFAALAYRLFRERGLDILLVGGPGEEDLAEAVRREMPIRCASVVGKTSIPELAALLAQAALVVGNDSAPIHFAMSVNTPAVSIVGGGHFGRFLPYPGAFPLRCVTSRMECFGCDWNCRFDTPLCITRVTPEQVWDAVEDLLG